MLSIFSETSILFLLFATLPAVATVVLIPRKVYKRYFIYGLIFGGIGDTVMVILLSSLKLIKYKNMGVFNVLGIYSIWTPVTWMFVMMLFLYFLPIRRLFLISYLLSWAGFNWAVGLVLQQLGMFEYIGFYIYFAPATFLIWYSVSAWIYLKARETGGRPITEKKTARFRIASEPAKKVELKETKVKLKKPKKL